MKIRELNIKGFGKFQGTRILLEDGINLISGENESGKSTLHAFVRGMLFGHRRQRGRASRNDSYSRYEPWENPGFYGGSLRFESGGKEFRLSRNFSRGQRAEQLVCESDGECLSLEDGDLDMLLGGISETVFDNTVSVEQMKGVTGEGLARELNNYMAGCQGGGDGTLDLKKAEENLKERRKELERELQERQKAGEARQQEIRARLSYLRRECEKVREELEEAVEVLKGRAAAADLPREGTRERQGRARKFFAALAFLLALGSLFLLQDLSLPLRIFLAVLFLGLSIFAGAGIRHRKNTAGETGREETGKLQWSTEYLRGELKDRERACANAEEEYRESGVLLAKRDPLETDLQALRLAGQVIRQLSADMQRRMGGRLRENISRLLQAITAGKYTGVSLDEELHMTLHTRENAVPLSRVSRGTVEQVYLALRLASAKLLCPEEELPLFLDEVFAQYDDRRLCQALRVLGEQSRQVLLFTCQNREEYYLKQLKIPYHKIVLQEENT